MESVLLKLKFLLFLTFLQFIAFIVILIDLPIARQVFGFLYFSFVPGFIFVKLLKMDELNRTETILFSLGFSIAFLMLIGVLLNEVGFSLGILHPLSFLPMMIIFNSFLIAGGLLVNYKKTNVASKSSKPIGFSPFSALFLSLPVLSIIGTTLVNAYENNYVLLVMILAIAMLFAFGLNSKKILPPKLYPFAILMIAIALLFHSVLISNYLIDFGSDVSTEAFVASSVQNNQYWISGPAFSSTLHNRINSMLSITILPIVYSTLLKIDVYQVFKFLYPLIFSFVPIALYQLWRNFFGRKEAFAAAFLIMAEATFYNEMVGLARQVIAELFLVLLLLVIFNKKMPTATKFTCFIIFSVGLVVSHYALAEIFLFFVFFAVISLFILKRHNINITISLVVIFSIIMFAWYIFTSGASVFESFVSYGQHILSQLGDFFDPSSRGKTVLLGLGMTAAPTIWNTISRIFAYITQGFIVVGFVGLFLKRIKINVERLYSMLSIAAMAILIAVLLIPGLATSFNATRFYHILLFLLAPFSVLGVMVLVKLFTKLKKTTMILIIIVIIFVPYFLFQTGFVYEVTGVPSWSLPLSINRMNGYQLYRSLGYVDGWGVSSATWLKKYVDTQQSQLYADVSSSSLLIGYGLVNWDSVVILSNTTLPANNGTIFLGPLNIVHETVATYSYSFNSDNLTFLDDIDLVYNNGGSEVYINP
jgi:uncharacterized membrane protein